MPLRDSEALILRTSALGEADRLVSFLSRSYGRLRGVARGARRPKSRFGATLQLLSYVRIWFYERETRELVRINQCEMLESFLEAHREYQRGQGLALLAEITESVLPEREPSDPAFRLLLAAVRAIERTSQTTLPLSYFHLWTVRLGGWLPSLDSCVRCHAALGGVPAFASAAHAGLLCSRCKLPGTRKLSAAALSGARRMLQERLEKFPPADWSGELAGELDGYMLDVIEHQIERKLTTRKLMESRS